MKYKFTYNRAITYCAVFGFFLRNESPDRITNFQNKNFASIVHMQNASLSNALKGEPYGKGSPPTPENASGERGAAHPVKFQAKNVAQWLLDNNEFKEYCKPNIVSHLFSFLKTYCQTEFVPIPDTVKAAYEDYNKEHSDENLKSFLVSVFKECDRNRTNLYTPFAKYDDNTPFRYMRTISSPNLTNDDERKDSFLTDDKKRLAAKISLSSTTGIRKELLAVLVSNSSPDDSINIINRLIDRGWLIEKTDPSDLSLYRVYLSEDLGNALRRDLRLRLSDCKPYLSAIMDILENPSTLQLPKEFKSDSGDIGDLCSILLHAFELFNEEYHFSRREDLRRQAKLLQFHRGEMALPLYKKLAEIYESVSPEIFTSAFYRNAFYKNKGDIYVTLGELSLFSVIHSFMPDNKTVDSNNHSRMNSFMNSLQVVNDMVIGFRQASYNYCKCDIDPLSLALVSVHLGASNTLGADLAALVSMLCISDDHPDNPIANPDSYLIESAKAFTDGCHRLSSVFPTGEEMPNFPFTLPLEPSPSYNQMPSNHFPSANELVKESSRARNFYNEGLNKSNQGNYIDALDDFRKSLEIYSRILSSSAGGAENPFDRIVKVMKDLLPKTADAYHSFQAEMEQRKELATNVGEKGK